MLFFCLGLVAFMASYRVNVAFALIVKSEGDLLLNVAPVVEEFFKMVPLLYFLLLPRRSRQMERVVSLGMATGIGFSILENSLYLTTASSAMTRVFVGYMFLRSVSTSVMHGATTATVGYGIAALRRSGSLMLPPLFGLFALAVTCHSLFNLYINSHLKIIGMFFPLLAYAVGLVVWRSGGEDLRPREQ